MDFSSLPTIHRQKFTELLDEFNCVFSKEKFDIGKINLEPIRIDLIDDRPINLRPYRCSLKDQETIDAQVQSLLDHGLIQRSISPYSFPITLVGKKDEGPRKRLCIDFRKLNQVTIPDNHPFPRIEDIIDKLYGCRVFSALDVASGFMHIPVENSSI